MGVALSCGYGFLASYEFGFPNVWHFLYCAVGVVAVMVALWLEFPAFKRVMTGSADWKSYWRLFQLAALFSLFSGIAFMIGHVAHLSLVSF